MASVFTRLQSLLTASPEPAADGEKAAPPAETPAAAPAETRAELEPEPGKRTRARRATDATVSSVSTTGSVELTRHEQQRLVAWRLDDLARLSRLHPAGKVLQHASWDCGLACVSMVLRAHGQALSTVRALAQQQDTASVWTIDLALLLAHNAPHVDLTYYTTCVGVNPGHAQQAFYHDMDADFARVIAQFSRARVDGRVRVAELALPLLDLKRFVVHRQYAALVLVDAAALRCVLCAQHRRGVRAWLARRRGRTPDFVGHYVLVIAYVPALDMFVYRDPAETAEFCLVAAAALDDARGRPGTDHDCIIVKI
ncbi:hypothetical protein IWW55_002956 [Coemansia sp. RSA 2706]|nr:hypothetical protein IWW55_002956 [Coemansia sp. RSA 2706]KAJ2313034.1 hypothetical protein IWW54_001747 [Coemansia sp. RSA 2705]KAJ2364434.1 hypothetical protein H4S01_003779 [Coemansia sp. RSA 2610]